MKHQCMCGGEKQTASLPMTTINGSHLARLASLSTEKLLATSKAAGASAKAKPDSGSPFGGGVETHFHITAEGDALATSTFVDGSTGDIVVRGVIAGVPYELHLRVSLEGEQVAVTLQLTKPIEIGPYTWHFNLGGAVRDPVGRIVSASSITPGAAFQPMGLDWWCVIKCGGATILPTLALCLPSLAGGPAAYIACVTAKLGTGDAAAIAACVASNCV
jgi:hypothetical protein